MADPELLRFLESLRARAEADTEIRWERYGDSAFLLRLPNLILRLSPRKSERDKPEGVDVVVTAPDAGLKLRSPFFKEEDGYDDIEVLLASAKSRTSDLEHLLSESAKYIESTVGPIGAPLVPPSSPPPVPARPTVEQAAEFFARISGTWHLDYERGQEDLSIDKNGNYFYLLKNRAGTIGQEIRPKFRLMLLFCDVESGNVEISKEELNGRVFQIEVLHVTDSTMVGFAKHDEHRLNYHRAK